MTPNSISANLTDLIASENGQPLDYSLVFFSPATPSAWAWLDQSSIPLLSAAPGAITNSNAGTYTALVFVSDAASAEAEDHAISAIAFTVLGDSASEFDITIDTAGRDPGERDSGSRSIGDLIIVNDNITGVVNAGSGDDVMWIHAGTGSHSLDGGGGDDALYGNDGNDRLDAGVGRNFLSGGGGNDVLIAGGGIDILMGGDGDDDISAGGGNDVLMGGAGNDVMNAGSGEDALLGNAGNDTLTGGSGADRFVYALAGAANVDTITDYRASSGDVIELSALLDEAFEPTSSVGDFARLVQTGSDITVQVDVNGTAGGANWADVAILSGYGTSGADTVRVFLSIRTSICLCENVLAATRSDRPYLVERATTCASVSTRPSCALLASSALSRLFIVSRS
jgi:hypothetical protein